MAYHIAFADHSSTTPGPQACPKSDIIVTATSVTTEDNEETANYAEVAGLDQIWRWNSEVPPTINRSMYEYFTEHVEHQPDRPAICSWDGSLTYEELSQHVNILAHHLLGLGIREGSIVPLCFEKSLWATVALLAVMRTGACFTLMDPSQPLARLQTIIAQVDAPVILTSATQEELGQRMKDNGTVISVNKTLFNVDNESWPDDSNFPDAKCDSPMYVQFTSGSTGKPKGVVISFASYTSGAIPRAGKVGYHAGSRCLDFPSYAFDVSIDCILCTLAMGGCVCVPSEDDRLNDLGGAIKSLAANMVHVTPSVARLLDPEIIKSIEVLGLGGEYVSPGDVEAWSTSCKLAIAYGPSECTVGCTINDEVSITNTGIGKGVGGVTWIVNANDQERLIAVGQVGELLIEGPIVGNGYLGQADKTAELFIEDPSWLLAGYDSYSGRKGRLYKTGDLVRYDDNGSITFIGRKDQQVKLRGQRVELGEVEHGLKRSLPANFSAVADVFKFVSHSEPALVAFFAEHTPKLDKDIEALSIPAEIQLIIKDAEHQMSDSLPRFMVPSNWIFLNALPMLVSGKIDRKRLREIGTRMSLRQVQQLKSQHQSTPIVVDDVEQKLLVAWQKVMAGVEIGRNDNFFHIGGDSLRAMHLVVACREQRLSLTVADIFNHPTLADMSTVVQPSTAQDASEIPPFSLLGDLSVSETVQIAAGHCGIDSSMIEDVYPCTPLQEGIMALSAKFSDAYVAQRVVDLPNVGTALALHNAFEAAAEDSCILRTRIVQVPHAGLLQVVVRPESGLSLQRHRDLEAYLKNDQENAMGLGSALARFALIESQIGRVQYVLSIHHSLYDGWCMPLIVERVNATFHRRTHKSSTPFKNFINFISQINRDKCHDFWKSHLQGPIQPQFPSLPYKHYITRADSLLEHRVRLTRPSTIHTMATLIRATWALVAAKHVGADNIVFGETLTGRNAAICGAEEIEGPMITTVPTKVRIDRRSRLTEHLRHIQDLAVQRMPYEHVGLQNIRRLSSDAREACDLRTGLVIHPRVEETAKKSTTSGPADGLVPASEAEAAHEALKFNTYALMLVFTMDTSGFLIMASFDSNCVSVSMMNQILKDFDDVVKVLSSSDDIPLSSIPSIQYEASQIPKIVNGIMRPPISSCKDATPSQLRDKLDTFPGVSTSGRNISPVDSVISRFEGLDTKEQLLSRIWGGVLGLHESDLSSQSNFFDYGDSISAMKVVSEARTENLRISVAQIFEHRELGLLAHAAQWIEENVPKTEEQVADLRPFSGLDNDLMKLLMIDIVRPSLQGSTWQIEDIYRTRPLQTVAVKATISSPRYSVRYEVIYFQNHLQVNRLQDSVQGLVNGNEILRTVFVTVCAITLGVVLSDLEAELRVHDVDGDVKGYVRSFCALDIQRIIELGSAFVTFHYVRSASGCSALIIKVSHAQYDEMCLPTLLHELSARYEDRAIRGSSVPFSAFVKHVQQVNLPEAMPYWRKLLQGTSMTTVSLGGIPRSAEAISLFKTFDISNRPRNITTATLPTAAWGLCLAKTMCLQDVVFGEVVSGRSTGLRNSDIVIGPCWQYVPVRLRVHEDMTYAMVLQDVQAQHIASSRFEGIAFDEIRKECTDWPDAVDWFGSVVHQDVEHVTKLPFETESSDMETIYPHLEPLREVKCQCFMDGTSITVEVVIYESWKILGQNLLASFADALENILTKPEGLVV